MEFQSADLIDQILNKGGVQAPSARKVQKHNLAQAIFEDKPDANGEVNSYRMKEALYNKITKDLKSPDISSLRLISLSDKVGELANDKVVFLKMLEANRVQRVTDFQVRMRERRLGQQTAQFFNMNFDAFAPEAQSNYPQRTNTVGFLGNQLNIRIIGEELAAQSPVQPVDIIQQEIEFEMIRIRRTMEQTMLWNQEITAEVAAVPPQWGGFINRSDTFTNTLASNSDFTNGLIQTAVDTIANITNPEGMGYIELVCLCPFAQMGKIRDLMISRYPGSQYDSYSTEQSQLGQKLSKEAGLFPEAFKFYKPDPGPAVLFISSPLLSTAIANTAVFFDPTQPQMGKMMLMGNYGPWVVERPTAALTTLLYCFDSATLLDNLKESRYVLYGVNQ